MKEIDFVNFVNYYFITLPIEKKTNDDINNTMHFKNFLLNYNDILTQWIKINPKAATDVIQTTNVSSMNQNELVDFAQSNRAIFAKFPLENLPDYNFLILEDEPITWGLTFKQLIDNNQIRVVKMNIDYPYIFSIINVLIEQNKKSVIDINDFLMSKKILSLQDNNNCEIANNEIFHFPISIEEIKDYLYHVKKWVNLINYVNSQASLAIIKLKKTESLDASEKIFYNNYLDALHLFQTKNFIKIPGLKLFSLEFLRSYFITMNKNDHISKLSTILEKWKRYLDRDDDIFEFKNDSRLFQIHQEFKKYFLFMAWFVWALIIQKSD